jgi:hypothetical protein
MGMINHLVDAGFGTGEGNNIPNPAAQSALATAMNIDVNSINVSEHEARCETTIGGSNRNVLSITMCPNGSPPGDISNITQEISQRVNTSCILGSMQQSNSSQGSSIDSTAFQSAVQDLHGANPVNSDTSSCTDISETENSCTYMKDKQCCSNSIHVDNMNSATIPGCAHVSGVRQDIDNQADANCQNEAYQLTATDQDEAAEAYTQDDTTITTEIDNTSTIIFAVVVCFVLIFIAFIIYMVVKNSPTSALAKTFAGPDTFSSVKGMRDVLDPERMMHVGPKIEP